MIEAFYALVIISFGCLGVFTLFAHMIRGGDIKNANVENQAQYDKLDERIAELRVQIRELHFNTDLLEKECAALEAQGKCMLEVEEDRRRQSETEDQGGS